MSDKTSNKLLPCPFCGGEAYEYHTGLHFKFCEVICKECGCHTDRMTVDEAITAWNTRKPMERIVERLEDYRDDFMEDIYEELRDDSDNLRANRIIERFDNAIEIVKEELDAK